jgi:hypothetical protein
MPTSRTPVATSEGGKVGACACNQEAGDDRRQYAADVAGKVLKARPDAHLAGVARSSEELRTCCRWPIRRTNLQPGRRERSGGSPRGRRESASSPQETRPPASFCACGSHPNLERIKAVGNPSPQGLACPKHKVGQRRIEARAHQRQVADGDEVVGNPCDVEVPVVVVSRKSRGKFPADSG